MLSRNRFCLLDRKIPHKSPDHIFDLNLCDSILYTINFLVSVLSFFIWVSEVPQQNSLLPVVLFFTYSSLFSLLSVLQILSLLFLCKNFLSIKKNNIPSWKSLFPVQMNYFNRDTNLSNQVMMSYVWREFSSVRWKVMK